MKQNIKNLINRYARYGLDVSFTEIDQGLSYSDRDKQSVWDAQEADYRALMELAVECPNVNSLIVWGLADLYSWRMSFDNTIQPLILGDYLQAKPAYTSMLNVLKNASKETGLEKVKTSGGAPVKQEAICNLYGIKVDADYKGIVIKNGKKYLQH